MLEEMRHEYVNLVRKPEAGKKILKLIFKNGVRELNGFKVRIEFRG